MNKQTVSKANTKTEIFEFDNGTEARECQAVIHVTNTSLSYAEQLDALLNTYDELRSNELRGTEAVFKRYYLSDAANQAATIHAMAAEGSDCALSVIEQAPLDGTKVALWVYMQSGVATAISPSGLYRVAHGRYTHLWDGGAHRHEANSELQTRLLLNSYVMQLAAEGCSLADNCIRTWFFVNDVDINYAGMVKARNEVFATQSLTPATHFIASTGIGGRQEDATVSVQMDNYAIKGICKEQIQHLYAADHMNRTSDYGVSFERGTCVEYGDRHHVFISGTASIDTNGDVVYPGDIRKQTERMWGNVEALLREAGCTFDDVAQMTIYLRDPADYSTVKAMFDGRFPSTPRLIVHAPVCRPGWLIEMECMAICTASHKEFAPF